MPSSTILSAVRQPLATALSTVAGNVYSYVPESVIPPAVVCVPDSPYLEFDLINKQLIATADKSKGGRVTTVFQPEILKQQIQEQESEKN